MQKGKSNENRWFRLELLIISHWFRRQDEENEQSRAKRARQKEGKGEEEQCQ